MLRLFGLALILLLSNAALGQQSPLLSKHAEKIKKQVYAYDDGTLVAVKVPGKPEVSGVLISEKDAFFQVEDSATHQNVTLSYEDVSKVKKTGRNYGKSHNGIRSTVAEVGGGVVILGLIIYVIVALHSGA